MKGIRLFIIEDHPNILLHQIKLLGTLPDITIVGTALSGEDAIDDIMHLDSLPHVVLCDLGLPKLSGIDVTAHIKTMYPAIEVLIFTVFEDEEKVLQAIRAGAAGYLLKGSPLKKVHEAIVDVHHGGTVIQPNLARRMLKYFSLPKDELAAHKHETTLLTTRELECLQMVAKGLSNNEAASVLNVSKATIRTHLEHIYQKFDVTNRVEAITEGIRQGIIDL